VERGGDGTIRELSLGFVLLFIKMKWEWPYQGGQGGWS
jgi:hypothetical protein